MNALLVILWLGCGCGGAAMSVEAAQDRNLMLFLLGIFSMGVGIFCGLQVLS